MVIATTENKGTCPKCKKEVNFLVNDSTNTGPVVYECRECREVIEANNLEELQEKLAA